MQGTSNVEISIFQATAAGHTSHNQVLSANKGVPSRGICTHLESRCRWVKVGSEPKHTQHTAHKELHSPSASEWVEGRDNNSNTHVRCGWESESNHRSHHETRAQGPRIDRSILFCHGKD
ncbi:hypothetical protein SARC_05740 [Sphaeroforma arctica JP610]|uniref:Uncharacterized protein n=1 Tax=Sphaeroforma arctica JP610 TaxID=667725 RepID=A0A0L0FZA5_9EUKA|nr:hypothetical protein SARC_05740 [Sphaeroforma arctica JP610]KNC81964.1 hypothetical protein SARC_05740 [Sphaeroforma arctica JP610]|eukprot:XP_014155866.1 hypothetical protein SARC_05740 [Sphaeroforma arctica JP610]